MIVAKLMRTTALVGALTMAAVAPAAGADRPPPPPHPDRAVSTAQAATQINADRLVGKSVTNAAREKVGDIGSVIINKDGSVAAVVLEVGGFLGMGQRNVAVAWNDLQILGNGENIIANVSKEQLKAMPEYKYADDRRLGTVYVDDRYRTTAPATTVRETRTMTPGQDARDTQVTPRDSTGIIGPRGEIRASNLIGAKVVNAENDSVGEIQEILLMREGKPQVIVSVGGFLGMGRHDVALNWDQLKLVRDGNSVRTEVNLSKDQLKSLPEYRTN